MFYAHAQKQTTQLLGPAGIPLWSPLPLLSVAACFDSFFHLRRRRHLLGRPCVGLEPHKLFSHLVIGPLREYPHDGQASFIHADGLDEGTEDRQTSLVSQLS